MPQPPWEPVPADEGSMGRINVAFRWRPAGGRGFLADPDVVRIFLRFLDRWTRETMCHARIYCFMPDRFEAIIGGHEEMSRPWRAIEGFRQSADNWLARTHPEWSLVAGNEERRIDEDEKRANVRAILDIPVDAGLVSDPYEYPFTGSMGFDLWRALE